MYRICFVFCIIAIAVALLFSDRKMREAAPIEPLAARADNPFAMGTIYYLEQRARPRMWCMSADGASNEPLPEGVIGEPSQKLHDGLRWFLAILPVAGESARDNSPRQDLFVISETGRTVRLTHSADMQVGSFTARWPIHQADHAVAWIARRLDRQGSVVEGGIYEAQLAIGRDGFPVGLADESVLPRIRFDLVSGNWDSASASLVPDVCGFDYAPDGAAVVYESAQQRIYVHDIISARSRLVTERGGCDPVWSFDGSVILFRLTEPLGAIVGVRPNGRNLFPLVQGCKGKSVVVHPIAGPDCDSFLYGRVSAQDGDGVTLDLTINGLLNHGDRSAKRGLHARTIPVAWR